MTEEAEVQPVEDSKSKFEPTAEVPGDRKVVELDALSGGGGSGGVQLFTQAAETIGLERPDKAPSDLLFDVDPRDPAVIVAFLVGVVCLVATIWYSRRRRRGRPSSGRGGGGGADGAVIPEDSAMKESSPSPVASPYNTRRRRVTTTPGSGSSYKSRASPSKVVILTPPQVALCEVLYDVYGGTVPSLGIDTKTVQQSGLSVSVGGVSLWRLRVGACWRGVLYRS